MFFWLSIALLGIFTAISVVVSDKKLSKNQKKRSVMTIWGIAASITVILLIVEYSYLIADFIHEI
ncbi:hypothetical protein [Paraliobacillus sp. JSM ZJ581]|uniref:hypothetical protein n=1 Tax=Paraliobacillus sp. JSM ZJ581 TaxID=3342118 RepID=UPI0035A8292A